MTSSFSEIHSIYQEILLMINETINRGLTIANVVLFSFWLIWGWIIGIFLSWYLYIGINKILLLLWCIGFLIILIPWILEHLLHFFFRKILINNHYKIISNLEKEYYDIDSIKKIPYILNSAKALNKSIKKDDLLIYLVITFWLYLEKRWIAIGLRWNYSYTKEMNRIILSDAQLIIDRKKQILLSLIEKIKIMEVELIKELLTDLRSDLSIQLTEQQQSVRLAKLEVEKNIQWSTELEHISELQITRLDKQIERFEELQRVLIKV